MRNAYWKVVLPAVIFFVALLGFAAQVDWESLFRTDIRQKAILEAPKERPVPENRLSHIRQDLAEREYHITYDSVKSTLQSPNRTHGIRAYYKPGQLTIVNRKDSAGHNFQFDLVNEGIFADGKKLFEPALTAQTDLQQNKLHIIHQGFTEEYINDTKGLRQNFIITNAPSGTKTLQVRLNMQGMLLTSAAENELSFSTESQPGRKRLLYSDLHCWDARNQSLPAALAFVDDRIQIEVRVSNAVFPVTIDPLITNGNPAYAGIVVGRDLSTSLMGCNVSSAGDVNGDDILLDRDRQRRRRKAYTQGCRLCGTASSKSTKAVAAISDGLCA